MTEQGDLSVKALCAEIALLEARVEAFAVAVDFIRAERDEALKRWAGAEERVTQSQNEIEQLRWMARLSADER